MDKFWEVKPLRDLTREEWESLCDGCAKCCLHKLEDEDTNEVFYTSVACRYLDDSNCQCTSYSSRHEQVPTCVWLKPEDVEHFHWLPATCAYRLVFEGKPLPSWHPLISGSSTSVHEAGISIKDKSVSELSVPETDWEDYIIAKSSDFF